ncbi:hypothetical protein HK098_005241, partial [Nowakowskiella sp. JEL0407]
QRFIVTSKKREPWAYEIDQGLDRYEKVYGKGKQLIFLSKIKRDAFVVEETA